MDLEGSAGDLMQSQFVEQLTASKYVAQQNYVEIIWNYRN